MHGLRYWIGLAGLAVALPAHAQLAPGLPALPLPAGQVLDRVGQDIQDVTGNVAQRLEDVRRTAANRLVRDYPDRIALDPDGFPARAGELVVDDPDDALIAKAVAKGYAVIVREDVLGVGYARLSVPHGRSLGQAIREIRKLGGKDVSADQLHAPSGSVAGPGRIEIQGCRRSPAILSPRERGTAAEGGGGEGKPQAVSLVASPLHQLRWPPSGGGLLVCGSAPAFGNSITVGVIDGGAAGAALSSGFATGAPRANDHGTAVASLISGAGTVRGGLPGARIASADVYGSDPAGGNATAIARAIGWMVQNRVSVVTISLVGPANPLLGKVIAAAQARGTVIVAAVGNNGPAAPPAYPASYPGVIAVTGIDGKGRALIEAGRASHLDYAAPGADMLAMGAGGRTMRVRGTSFAAPFVAATIARFYPAPDLAGLKAAISKVDGQARDAGSRGADKLYGRGVLCEACRTPAQ